MTKMETVRRKSVDKKGIKTKNVQSTTKMERTSY